MASFSAQDVVSQALSTLGVYAPGQTLNPEDLQQGFQALNLMLDSWQLERLFIYTVTELPTVTLAANTASITVGPGGFVNVPERPIDLEDWSFVRDNNIDYRIKKVNGEQYSSMTLKSLVSTYPYYLYYDKAYPLANVTFWPLATKNLELHLRVQSQLSSFADVGTKYSFPQGYQRAMYLSLAEEMSPTYGKEMSMGLSTLAAKARHNVKRGFHVTPVLDVDADLYQRRRRGFNIYTGE